MANPYQPIHHKSSELGLKWQVGIILGIALLCVAFAFGLYVLNQDVQLVPTERSFYLSAVNGIPVSNTWIAGLSFMLSVCLGAFGAAVVVFNSTKKKE